MLAWEKKAFLDGASVIIGVDEAGRGPLAGPVVAAAVMFSPAPLKRFTFSPYKEKIDDSKRLRPCLREKAFSEISDKTLFRIGIKDQSFIDTKNIYRATIEAMKEAVTGLINDFCRLTHKKEKDIRKDICVLIDGNMRIDLGYKTVEIIEGDSKSFSIACASIVAKVIRDKIMKDYEAKYPLYGFSSHKGYGTKAHLEALKKYGPCPIHRKTFAPVKNMHTDQAFAGLVSDKV